MDVDCQLGKSPVQFAYGLRLCPHKAAFTELFPGKIFNPQLNPQFDMSCMTCAAFGSPRVSSKLL